MTVNLKESRGDIIYLKRRLRKEEPKRVSEPVNSPSQNNSSAGSGISLKREVAPGVPTPAQVTGASRNVSLAPPSEQKFELFEAPKLKGNMVLGETHNVVRLNPLQSAIGTLAFMHSGYAAWEESNGRTGFLYANSQLAATTTAPEWATGEEHPPLPEVATGTYGNRALLEFHKGVLVYTLRHYAKLKRLVVVPEAGKDLLVGTFTGATLTVPGRNNQVLYLSVVNNEVELRLEQYRGNIYETFRIGTYQPGGAGVQAQQDSSSPHSLQNFFSNS